ncbi:Leucine zipper protein 2, partial [Camelus dromedarius]
MQGFVIMAEVVGAKWKRLGGSHAFSFCVRQDYEELEKQLKEVFKERSTILRRLTKTSRELDGIKFNLQTLKNDEKSAKTEVQRLLEISQKQ